MSRLPNIEDTLKTYLRDQVNEIARSHGHRLGMEIVFRPSTDTGPKVDMYYTLHGNLDEAPNTQKEIDSTLGKIFKDRWKNSIPQSPVESQRKDLSGILYACSIEGRPEELINHFIVGDNESIGQTEHLVRARKKAAERAAPRVPRH